MRAPEFPRTSATPIRAPCGPLSPSAARIPALSPVESANPSRTLSPSRHIRESEERVRLAFTGASHRIYWMAAFLAFVAGLLAARIPEIPLRRTHDRAEMGG